MKVRADQIKHALSHRHTNDLFLTEVKTGATWLNNELLKFDAFAIKRSWANPCFYGYEIKVSRQDFINDQKWPGYMKSCNRFSFVCPKGLIQPEELAEEVGLLWYYPDTGAIVSKRQSKHRIIEMPRDLLFYILISRTEDERHPFFTTAREKMEAYIADKVTTKGLAQELSSKLIDKVKELEEKNTQLIDDAEMMKTDVKFANDVRTLLQKHGIRGYYGDHVLDKMQDRLSSGVTGQVRDAVFKLSRTVDELKILLEPNKGENQT